MQQSLKNTELLSHFSNSLPFMELKASLSCIQGTFSKPKTFSWQTTDGCLILMDNTSNWQDQLNPFEKLPVQTFYGYCVHSPPLVAVSQMTYQSLLAFPHQNPIYIPLVPTAWNTPDRRILSTQVLIKSKMSIKVRTARCS